MEKPRGHGEGSENDLPATATATAGGGGGVGGGAGGSLVDKDVRRPSLLKAGSIRHKNSLSFSGKQMSGKFATALGQGLGGLLGMAAGAGHTSGGAQSQKVHSSTHDEEGEHDSPAQSHAHSHSHSHPHDDEDEHLKHHQTGNKYQDNKQNQDFLTPLGSKLPINGSNGNNNGNSNNSRDSFNSGVSGGVVLSRSTKLTPLCEEVMHESLPMSPKDGATPTGVLSPIGVISPAPSMVVFPTSTSFRKENKMSLDAAAVKVIDVL